MKKLGLIVISTGILFSNCNKKEIGQVNSNNSIGTTTNAESLKQKASWGICCVWNGVDNCVKPAVNCFDEIIVKPKYTDVAKALSNFDIAVNNGADAIASFFTSNDAQVLFPDLTCICDKNPYVSYLNKLISGKYYISRMERGNKFFYLVKPNGTNNVDFVLTIKKEGE